MGRLEKITIDDQLGMLSGFEASESSPVPEFSIIDHELPGLGANRQIVPVIPELRDGIGRYIHTGEFDPDLEYLAAYAKQYMQRDSLDTTIALGRKIGLNHASYASDRAMQERMQTVAGDLDKLINQSDNEVRGQRESLSDWKVRGMCYAIDPDLMLPQRGEPVDHLKAICVGCPVLKLCLAEALSKPVAISKGILGGTSERDRRVLRRDMRLSGMSSEEYVDVILPYFAELDKIKKQSVN